MGPSDPTRLERHRDEYVARLSGSLLSYDELSPEDLKVLSQAIFSRASSEGGARSPYEVMVDVLTEWAVMCPHPSQTPGGGARAPEWSTCDVCGCAVIERSTCASEKTAQRKST